MNKIEIETRSILWIICYPDRQFELFEPVITPEGQGFVFGMLFNEQYEDEPTEAWTYWIRQSKDDFLREKDWGESKLMKPSEVDIRDMVLEISYPQRKFDIFAPVITPKGEGFAIGLFFNKLYKEEQSDAWTYMVRETKEELWIEREWGESELKGGEFM